MLNLRILLLASSLLLLQGCSSNESVNKPVKAEVALEDKVDLIAYSTDGMDSVEINKDKFNVALGEKIDLNDFSVDTKDKLGLKDNDNVLLVVKRVEMNDEVEVNVDVNTNDSICHEVVVEKFVLQHKENSVELLDTEENNNILDAISGFNLDVDGQVLQKVVEGNRFFVIESDSNKTGVVDADNELRSQRANNVMNKLADYGLTDNSMRIRNILADEDLVEDASENEDHMHTVVYVVDCANGNAPKKKDDKNLVEELDQLCKVKPLNIDVSFKPNETEVDLDVYHQSVNKVVDYLFEIHQAEKKIEESGEYELANPNGIIMNLSTIGNKTDNKNFANAQAAARAANYQEAIKNGLIDKGVEEEEAQRLVVERVRNELIADKYLNKSDEHTCVITQEPTKYVTVEEEDEENTDDNEENELENDENNEEDESEEDENTKEDESEEEGESF